MDGTENFFNEMIDKMSGEITNFCRMAIIDFEFRLNTLEPLMKKNTLRIPISPKIHLTITLRYLATGDSYRSRN